MENKEKLEQLCADGVENTVTATHATLKPGEYTWLYSKPGRGAVITCTDLDASYEADICIYTDKDGWVAYNKKVEAIQTETSTIDEVTPYGVYVKNNTSATAPGRPAVQFTMYPM